MNPTPASMTVACDATTIVLSFQARCRATVALTDGSTQDQTAAAQWSTSNPTIAAVSGGLVTTLAPGSVDVRASYQMLAAAQQLTIAPLPPRP